MVKAVLEGREIGVVVPISTRLMTVPFDKTRRPFLGFFDCVQQLPTEQLNNECAEPVDRRRGVFDKGCVQSADEFSLLLKTLGKAAALAWRNRIYEAPELLLQVHRVVYVVDSGRKLVRVRLILDREAQLFFPPILVAIFGEIDTAVSVCIQSPVP